MPSRTPIEPAATTWALPDIGHLPGELADEDLVGLGADLEPGTLLAAYRGGLFPMHVRGDEALIGWWSPAPRGVLPLDQLVVSRSLRQSCRRLTTTVDQAFEAVMDGCADRGEQADQAGWINDGIRTAYTRLHELGWAHSVETWEDDRLVGGLYGVAIGGLFAGESMFFRVRDASKVALVRLVDELGEGGVPRLLDVQWVTDHLATLGAVWVPRETYRELLAAALELPLPPTFGGGVHPSLSDRD
jgi:leucyl/phenylalanyl-tRNA---protein transferase